MTFYDVNTVYEWASFLIFLLINVGSIITAAAFGWWYLVKLRESRTTLRYFIGSVALAKFNLAGWSAANMYAMAFQSNDPPLISLPFRIIWILVIYIQFRAVMSVRPTPSASAVAEMISTRRRNRILILEDDSDVAEIYKLALGDYGYDVVVAGTGAYALTVMDWQMPKIAIIDIKLPDMTGYEFIAAARRKGYTGPAIAVSGLPIDNMRGFTATLQKPFRPQQIVDVVAKFMEQ